MSDKNKKKMSPRLQWTLIGGAVVLVVAGTLVMTSGSKKSTSSKNETTKSKVSSKSSSDDLDSSPSSSSSSATSSSSSNTQTSDIKANADAVSIAKNFMVAVGTYNGSNQSYDDYLASINAFLGSGLSASDIGVDKGSYTKSASSTANIVGAVQTGSDNGTDVVLVAYIFTDESGDKDSGQIEISVKGGKVVGANSIQNNSSNPSNASSSSSSN